jgi:hypothetical protein
MKTFRQWLQQLQESVRGPTIRTISHSLAHDFTRNSPSKQTRFVIDNNDKLHIGDAYNFIHAQIATRDVGVRNDKWVKDVKYVGYISHPDKSYSIARTGSVRDSGYQKAGKLEGRAKDLEDHLNSHDYERGKDGDWDR